MYLTFFTSTLQTSFYLSFILFIFRFLLIIEIKTNTRFVILMESLRFVIIITFFIYNKTFDLFKGRYQMFFL